MRARLGLVRAPLAYLVLAVLLHGPAFVDLTSRTRCACRDQPQTDWFLAFTPHALLAGRSPWVTDALAVPDRVNLLWNTGMQLPGVLLAPVTLLAGPAASHTLLSVLAFAGSATALWWVVGRWAPWPPARFFAGLLYGFSPYLVAQGSGHLNLELVALPPLMLAVADEIVVRQRRRPARLGAMLGALALAQLLTAEEVLASTALVAAIGVVVLAVQQRRRLDLARTRYAAAGVASAAAVLAVGGAWPLSVQFLGPGRILAPVHSTTRYAADLLGPVVPTVHQLLGTTLTAGWAGNDSENGSYLGLPLLALLGVLGWRCRQIPVVRFAAALAGAVWLLSLGSRLHVAGRQLAVPLPFAGVAALPVLRNLAAVRLSLYVALLAALVLAVGLDRLQAEGWFGRHRAAGWAVAAACVLTLLPPGPYSYVDTGVPAYFTTSAVRRIPVGSVVFTYPVPRSPRSAPMEWQAAAGFRYRSLGGYVITRGPGGAGTFGGGQTTWEQLIAPAVHGEPMVVSAADRQRLLRELADLQARAVLVADGVGAATVDQFVTSLLARGPDAHIGGVAAWYL